MLPNKKITELELEDVKEYMRVEYDYDDDYIKFYLNSARSYIQNMMKIKFEDFGDDLPLELSIAALSLCEHWYKNKGIEGDFKSKEIVHNFKYMVDLHRDYFGVEN